MGEDSLLGCGAGDFFFWEYLDLMIRILSGIRNIKDIGNPHIWVISNVCSFQMYSEGFCNFH